MFSEVFDRKKILQYLGILVILLVGAFLRLQKLGGVPHGMTWDEAAIGYNGYAVLTTRRDEWLIKLPISFKSFGDYKAPIAIYLNGPFTYFFGMNLFAVRLPFALSGILSCVLFYALITLLYKDHPWKTYIEYVGTSLFVLSPWHIHFSRIGFESGISLLFFLAGMVCTIYFLTYFQNKKPICQYAVLATAVISFVVSIYAYHSAKIVVPLIMLVLLLLFRKETKVAFLKFILPAALFWIVLLVPLLRDSVYGSGAERAGVLFINEQLPITKKFALLIGNYVQHFSPQFMIFGKTDTLRHGPGVWSVLLPITYIAILFMIVTVFTPLRKKLFAKKAMMLGFALVIIGLLPAALTHEVPHANRALLALPGCILLALSGMELFVGFLQDIFSKKVNQIVIKMVIGLLITIELFSFMSFYFYYNTVFAAKSATAFQDGYLEAFAIAKKYEKGSDGMPEVKQILIDDGYGQPYIYALFTRKTNPIWYQGGSLIKYQFISKIDVSDLERDDTLLVARPNDTLPIQKANHLVYGSDGSVRFAIFYTGKK